MSLNLIYGKQRHFDFLDAGEIIAKDVSQGKFFEISKKINHVFFEGGIFDPKSFESLFSIYIPERTTCVIYEPNGHSYIIIKKKTSYSAVMGFVEGIPIVGSPIAAINTIYHLFGMLSSRSTLKKAVKNLNSIERTDYNVRRGASSYYTEKVFAAAIDCTVHPNYLVGSLLSIIPLVKPIVRLAQGVIYNVRRPQ